MRLPLCLEPGREHCSALRFVDPHPAPGGAPLMLEEDNSVNDSLVIDDMRLVARLGFVPESQVGKNVVLVSRIAPHAMDTRIRPHIVGLGLLGLEEMGMRRLQSRELLLGSGARGRIAAYILG